MATVEELVQRVLDVARTKRGYVEQGGRNGHSGNMTDFWRELDPKLQGNPWCAAYVSWVFKHAGIPLPAIDKPYGFVFVPNAVNWAKAHGRFSRIPSVGAIALYGYGGSNGYAVHTGIVASVSRNGRDFLAIEGNTAVGHDVNGGSVMERQRNVDWTVGFLVPDFVAWNVTPEELKPMYDPPVQIASPIVADLACPTGGAWTVSEDGSVQGWAGAPYHGGANGKPYFANQKAVRLELREADPMKWSRSNPPYRIRVADPHSGGYGDGGF